MAKEKKKTPAKAKEATPAPAEHFDPLSALRGEVDRLFDEFAGRWPFGMFPARARSLLAPLSGWPVAPAVDIVDLEKEIQIRAELPGIAKDDIDIEIEGDTLSISGEKKEEKTEGEKDGRYYLSERRYGSVQRSLSIPDGADKNKPEARFAHGVLTVIFPKTKEARAKAKKVKIKSG